MNAYVIDRSIVEPDREDTSDEGADITITVRLSDDRVFTVVIIESEMIDVFDDFDAGYDGNGAQIDNTEPNLVSLLAVISREAVA